MSDNKTRHLECWECGKPHPAHYSHISEFGGGQRVYSVVCTETGLTDYFTDDAAFSWR